ncbi:MAG: hypothetical protein JWM78_1343 [Verrucomicrobiaceae bacterium]|nr:hypothetical protein [Verrucomicrobiaceae bacterium]
MLAMKLRFALNIIFIFAMTGAANMANADSRVAVFNAEDFALLDGGKWVISSSMLGGQQAQGGMYAIDVRTGVAQQIYPNSAAEKSTLPGCPEQVAAAEFAPHGVALHKSTKGETLLYVVNHGGRESIEIFAVELRDKPVLHWRGCLVEPAGAFGNAVAVAADDTVYMTNMGRPMDGSAAFSPFGGDVLAWTAATGWRTVPNSALEAPNGLLVSADGGTLYVASWTQSEMFKLTLATGDTKREVLKLPLLPDNLRWSDDGSIFATGHRTAAALVQDCYVATGRCEKPIPSGISKIDPKSLTISCSSDIDQSMATTTLIIGDDLWVGTARGDSILRKPRSTWKCN